MKRCSHGHISEPLIAVTVPLGYASGKSGVQVKGLWFYDQGPQLVQHSITGTARESPSRLGNGKSRKEKEIDFSWGTAMNISDSGSSSIQG